MNYVVIIIGIILMFIVLRFYFIMKARYAVRNFFKLAELVESEYKEYKENDECESEAPKEILEIAKETILYCEGSGLLEVDEPTIKKTYTDIKNIIVELRRDLWVKNANIM